MVVVGEDATVDAQNQVCQSGVIAAQLSALHTTKARTNLAADRTYELHIRPRFTREANSDREYADGERGLYSEE